MVFEQWLAHEDTPETGFWAWTEWGWVQPVSPIVLSVSLVVLFGSLFFFMESNERLEERIKELEAQLAAANRDNTERGAPEIITESRTSPKPAPVPNPAPEPESVATKQEESGSDVEGEFRRWLDEQRQTETGPVVTPDEPVQVIEETPKPKRRRKSKPTPGYRLCTFKSPHDEKSTIEAVLASMAESKLYRDGEGQFVVEHFPDESPRSTCLYFSEVDSRRIVLNLGNRSTLYWSMTIDFEPRDSGMYGVVGFDRTYQQIKDDWYNGELTCVYAQSVAITMPSLLERRYGFEVNNLREYGPS